MIDIPKEHSQREENCHIPFFLVSNYLFTNEGQCGNVSMCLGKERAFTAARHLIYLPNVRLSDMILKHPKATIAALFCIRMMKGEKYTNLIFCSSE